MWKYLQPNDEDAFEDTNDIIFVYHFWLACSSKRLFKVGHPSIT